MCVRVRVCVTWLVSTMLTFSSADGIIPLVNC